MNVFNLEEYMLMDVVEKWLHGCHDWRYHPNQWEPWEDLKCDPKKDRVRLPTDLAVARQLSREITELTRG